VDIVTQNQQRVLCELLTDSGSVQCEVLTDTRQNLECEVLTDSGLTLEESSGQSETEQTDGTV